MSWDFCSLRSFFDYPCTQEYDRRCPNSDLWILFVTISFLLRLLLLLKTLLLKMLIFCHWFCSSSHRRRNQHWTMLLVHIYSWVSVLAVPWRYKHNCLLTVFCCFYNKNIQGASKKPILHFYTLWWRKSLDGKNCKIKCFFLYISLRWQTVTATIGTVNSLWQPMPWVVSSIVQQNIYWRLVVSICLIFWRIVCLMFQQHIIQVLLSAECSALTKYPKSGFDALPSWSFCWLLSMLTYRCNRCVFPHSF